MLALHWFANFLSPAADPSWRQVAATARFTAVRYPEDIDLAAVVGAA